jgi:hypothetical protein
LSLVPLDADGMRLGGRSQSTRSQSGRRSRRR